MDDQKILEYIAVKQSIRAAQLVDKFDVDLKTASDALRALVDAGDVVRASGFAPNNQPAQIYSLSESFVKSKAGQLIIARMEAVKLAAPVPEAEPSPVPVAPVAVAASTAPAIPSTPIPAPPASINRAEVGVAYIRKLGSVTESDLRVAMDLRADQYPSAWLSGAVKRGEVNKDGKEWKVGPGSDVKKQSAFGGGISLPGSTPHPATGESKPASSVIPDASARFPLGSSFTAPVPDVPKFSDQGLHATATLDVSKIVSGTLFQKPTSPSFRVGIWSDGALELQRGGVTVAALNQAEHEAVAEFIARIRQPVPA